MPRAFDAEYKTKKEADLVFSPQKDMKLTTAIFLAQFVQSSPPDWWSNYSADQRIDSLEDNVSTLFETLFNTTKYAHLERHYLNIINKLRRKKTSCQSADSPASDWALSPWFSADDSFMENGVIGNAQSDIYGLRFNLELWARWEIQNRGGKCICEAERLVRL